MTTCYSALHLAWHLAYLTTLPVPAAAPRCAGYMAICTMHPVLLRPLPTARPFRMQISPNANDAINV
jgi:hypothetical protein